MISKRIFLIIYLTFIYTYLQGQNIQKYVEFEQLCTSDKIEFKVLKSEMNLSNDYLNKYNVSYTTLYDSVEYTENYEFILNETPKGNRIKSKYDDDFLNDTIELKYISKKEFNLENHKILIYKYFFDLDNNIDEELLIFFIPEYGIFMKKPYSWLGYSRLTDNENLERKELFNKICEIILYDNHFFRNVEN